MDRAHAIPSPGAGGYHRRKRAGSRPRPEQEDQNPKPDPLTQEVPGPGAWPPTSVKESTRGGPSSR